MGGNFYTQGDADTKTRQEQLHRLKLGIGSAAGSHGLNSLRHSTHARNDRVLPITHLPSGNDNLKSMDATKMPHEGSKLKDWMTKLKPGKPQGFAYNHTKTNSVIVDGNSDLLTALGHEHVSLVPPRAAKDVGVRRSIQNGAMVIDNSAG